MESTSSEHMISQFKTAIEAALASSVDTRADMRAQCAKPHISVSRWRKNLSILHNNAIRLSQGTSQKACSMESCNRSPICSNKGLRFIIPGYSKSRGGRLSGSEKLILQTKPRNFTSKPTWPRSANTTTSTPDQRLKRGHLFRHTADSRDPFSKIDRFGTSGTTFWYVLIVFAISVLSMLSSRLNTLQNDFNTLSRCMRCSMPVLVHLLIE